MQRYHTELFEVAQNTVSSVINSFNETVSNENRGNSVEDCQKMSFATLREGFVQTYTTQVQSRKMLELGSGWK